MAGERDRRRGGRGGPAAEADGEGELEVRDEGEEADAEQGGVLVVQVDLIGGEDWKEVGAGGAESELPAGEGTLLLLGRKRGKLRAGAGGRKTSEMESQRRDSTAVRQRECVDLRSSLSQCSSRCR